jgi:hypothetical protein
VEIVLVQPFDPCYMKLKGKLKSRKNLDCQISHFLGLKMVEMHLSHYICILKGFQLL